ncbi:MAG: hypothetical protein LBL52_03615 [Rickettsiales bacterium]|jgi:hypothetical protein|nr:hypothetical protein [Rickettsiales bacterium]
MKQLKGILEGKKTYVAAVVGIITVLGAYMTGEIEAMEAGEVALSLLGVMFLKREMSASAAAKLSKLKK